MCHHDSLNDSTKADAPDLSYEELEAEWVEALGLDESIFEEEDGDVDDERDGEEHQADDAKPGKHHLEGALIVTAIIAGLLLHRKTRVTF